MENKLERPIIEINKTILDKVVEALALILLIVLWFTVVFNYSDLPEKIPSHYDFNGNVDSYNSKGTLFILPIIGTFIWMLLSLLNKYPNTFNIPVKINLQNAKYQYRLAQRLLRFIKTYILIEFLIITEVTILIAHGQRTWLQSYMAISIVPIFLILIIYFYLASKKS